MYEAFGVALFIWATFSGLCPYELWLLFLFFL